MNTTEVLSFDSTKIRIVDEGDGIKRVKKITTYTEYLQIAAAYEYLSEKRISIGEEETKILVAEVLGWDKEQNILTLPFCEGDNLEYLIKSSFRKTRDKIIHLMRDFFHESRKKGFMWGDLAPRNMIYNQSRNLIHLVDFERLLILSGELVFDSIFARHLRNYAMEEFACLLFKDEQKKLFSGLIDETVDHKVQLSNIQSNRKKALLKNMFGFKESYLIREMQTVETIMADIATPLRTKEGVIYPMFFIEKAIQYRGVDFYISLTQRLMEGDDEEKLEIIKQIS